MFSSCSLAWCLVFVALISSRTLGLPPGFVTEGVGRFKRITDISTIPLPPLIPPRTHKSSSILLITLKEGPIHVIEDPDNNPDRVILAADFSDRICNNGERGVQAAVAHPLFRSNRYVYVYYTYKGGTNCQESRTDGPVNRCSRFLMHANTYTLDLASERVLFQTSRLEKRYHNGGDMEFGPDGNLYISIGDGGVRSGKISQETNDLLGSIVRITGNGNIPADNPFRTGVRCNATGTAPEGKPCREIYATGLRNPYKLAVDPNEMTKTRIMVSEVGGQTWEEANLAGTDFPGANYGWPEREGPCSAHGNAGNNLEDCTPDPRFQEPEHFYLHRDKTDDGGGAIVGGAIIPNGHWPTKYDDGFFFADFVFGEIYHLSKKQGGGCQHCAIPTSSFRNETFHSWRSASAMVFAPYKDTVALYFGAQKLTAFTLHRIVFVGGSNVSPNAVIEAKKTAALVGQDIELSAAKSSDADRDPLTYEWDLGDGRTVSGVDVTVTYPDKGSYVVVLTVRDGQGGRGQATTTISIGSPPTVKIDRPVDGTMFAVGDVFTLRGSAADANGNPLPDSALSWEVRQHHATHWHPFLSPTPGERVVLFPAPAPEDFLAATNSHLEILLTATDGDGLSATVTRTVMPKSVWLDIKTNPGGVDVYLDDFRIVTPQRVLSWENHDLEVRVGEVDDLVFSGWSDGGGKEHTISIPTGVGEGTLEFVASFESPDSVLTQAASIPVAAPSPPPVARPVANQATVQQVSTPVPQPVATPIATQTSVPQVSVPVPQPIATPIATQTSVPQVSVPVPQPIATPIATPSSADAPFSEVDTTPTTPSILEMRSIGDFSGGPSLSLTITFALVNLLLLPNFV